MYQSCLDIPAAKRAAYPSDFRSIIDCDCLPAHYRPELIYCPEPPASIRGVSQLNQDALTLFLQEDTDGLFIKPSSPTAISGLSEFAAAKLPLLGVLNNNYTLEGCLTATAKAIDTEVSPANTNPIIHGKTLLAENLEQMGNFLKSARQAIRRSDSSQCWAELLNVPNLGASFHTHGNKLLANAALKGPGTEVFFGTGKEVFQFPSGTIFIWKGDRVLHRQPSPENPIAPYERTDTCDQRLLLVVSIDLGR